MDNTKLIIEYNNNLKETEISKIKKIIEHYIFYENVVKEKEKNTYYGDNAIIGVGMVSAIEYLKEHNLLNSIKSAKIYVDNEFFDDFIEKNE